MGGLKTRWAEAEERAATAAAAYAADMRARLGTVVSQPVVAARPIVPPSVPDWVPFQCPALQHEQAHRRVLELATPDHRGLPACWSKVEPRQPCRGDLRS